MSELDHLTNGADMDLRILDTKAAKRKPSVPSRAPTQRTQTTRRRQRYTAALERACTVLDLHIIMKTAVEEAKLGDHDARKFVFEYLIGKPKASEPTVNATQINISRELFGDSAPRGTT